jgi:hypothetical protein
VLFLKAAKVEFFSRSYKPRQSLLCFEKKARLLFIKSPPPFREKPACFLKKQAGFLNLPLVLFLKARRLFKFAARAFYSIVETFLLNRRNLLPKSSKPFYFYPSNTSFPLYFPYFCGLFIL